MIEIVKRIDFEFAVFYERIKEQSEETRSHFLFHTSRGAWKKYDNVVDFFELFRRAYLLQSFTATDETLLHYDLLLNSKRDYKWIIPMAIFMQKVDVINSRGVVYIPKYIAFWKWFFYIDIQIASYCRREILPIISGLDQFKATADEKFLKKLRYAKYVEDECTNLNRRLKYDGKNLKNEFDEEIGLMMEKAKGIIKTMDPDGSDPEKILKKIFTGKAEELLSQLFDLTFLIPGNKPIEKYVHFFELLQFLLKDKTGTKFKFKSEEDFLYGKGLYRNNYRIYQQKQVISVLGRR